MYSRWGSAIPAVGPNGYINSMRYLSVANFERFESPHLFDLPMAMQLRPNIPFPSARCNERAKIGAWFAAGFHKLDEQIPRSDGQSFWPDAAVRRWEFRYEGCA